MVVFTFRQKVRFQHCDPAGIVFYPRYFEMLNACVETWCDERLNYSFAQMHSVDHKGIPLVRVSAEFRAPSRLGDDLALELVPTKLGNSSVDLKVDITCNGETRATFTSRVVFFSMETGRAERWPDPLRKKIEIDLEEHA